VSAPNLLTLIRATEFKEQRSVNVPPQRPVVL
jgi:hypothetical protein